MQYCVLMVQIDGFINNFKPGYSLNGISKLRKSVAI